MRTRGLQAVTAALALLAVVTGILAVAGGPASMIDGRATTPTVDSEVRFMAVYWLASGVLALYLVPRVREATLAYRAWLAVMFASGIARAVSFAEVGRPYPVIVAGMAVELALPPVLWLWQARAGHEPTEGGAAMREEL